MSRELDREVAIKVMGFKGENKRWRPKHYSSNMNHAMEVAAKLVKKGFITKIVVAKEDVLVELYDSVEGWFVDNYCAPSIKDVPLAICKLALANLR
jgi:hypothetical protein